MERRMRIFCEVCKYCVGDRCLKHTSPRITPFDNVEVCYSREVRRPLFWKNDKKKFENYGERI